MPQPFRNLTRSDQPKSAMKVFLPLTVLFLFQSPTSFLVACAPVSVEHHRSPAFNTVKGQATFMYPSLYDMCLRTTSTRKPFCRRVTLDRATAAQRNQEQATELLESAVHRPTTTVLVTSSVQQEDKRPATSSNSSLDPPTILVYIYRTLKFVIKSSRCILASVVAVFAWIGSSEDDLIVTGLILSMIMQSMLVYWLWMDAGVVCIWNSSYYFQASTLIWSFLHKPEPNQMHGL